MRALHAACALVAALVLSGCAAAPTGRALPTPERSRDDVIRSAEQALVTRCLASQGLTTASKPATPAEDRRLQAAVFGSGPSELSLTLPTGYTVTAHTDGCLASARHTLYGDQRRWFRAQVTVNNLRAEAGARMRTDPAHRTVFARYTRCLSGRSPRQPEQAAATRCARESGLTAVEARLEPARLAEVRALRREQLTTYAQLRTRALHRAAELSPAQPQGNPTEKGTHSP
ncbi:hypothetical protein ACWGI8_14540 [Streptomyces sp. NPDC054841]